MNKILKLSADMNPNPILSVGMDGTVLYSNEAGEPLLHVWGTNTGEKLPPYIRDFMQKVISQNIPEKMEVNVGKKTYIVEFYHVPEEGYVHGYGFDISDQKEIEARLLEAYEDIQTQSEELQESNAELKAQSEELQESYDLLHEKEKEILTLTENSPDLIGRFDRQNHCLYANPAFMRFYYIPPIAEFYGWSAREFINKTQAKLQIDPELVKLSEKQRANVFVTGKPESLDFRYKSPQGKEYYFDTKIVPEFVNGEVTSVLVISRDLTERKQAEEALQVSELRLRRLYESGMIGMIYFTFDGSINDANDKFLEMVGYTHEDLEAGKINWEQMTPPEYRALDECAIYELETTGVDTPYEKEYIRKDGSKIPIIIGGATFDNERHKGIAFVLDIAERKKAEANLKNTLDNLDNLVKERTAELENAYNTLKEVEIARKQEIHHRIKNNLQVISSLLDLQAEQFENKECIKDSEVLEAFKESQDRVISMALIHEELYKGGGFETLNFIPYIHELTENLFHTYSVGNNNIILKLDLVENAFFDMDIAVPLGMIINELVSNSLKHAFKEKDKGEIKIKLSGVGKIGEYMDMLEESKTEDCNSTAYVLSISDNGIGIPEELEIEDLETLGMQLVTALVDQLDGELELIKDKGTEFIIRFTVPERKNPASEAAPQLIE